MAKQFFRSFLMHIYVYIWDDTAYKVWVIFVFIVMKTIIKVYRKIKFLNRGISTYEGGNILRKKKLVRRWKFRHNFSNYDSSRRFILFIFFFFFHYIFIFLLNVYFCEWFFAYILWLNVVNKFYTNYFNFPIWNFPFFCLLGYTYALLFRYTYMWVGHYWIFFHFFPPSLLISFALSNFFFSREYRVNSQFGFWKINYQLTNTFPFCCLTFFEKKNTFSRLLFSSTYHIFARSCKNLERWGVRFRGNTFSLW